MKEPIPPKPNRDQPAFSSPAIARDLGGVLVRAAPGLTKREYMATAVLQGLAASDCRVGMSDQEMAENAVLTADLLLAELEKPK